MAGPAGSPEADDLLVCVDVGSTSTKAVLVDGAAGRVVTTTSHRTTTDTDVLEGIEACVETLARHDPRARGAEVLACSSAGGGLRIAVVGGEELVTAEAGRRVALSSGGRVVDVVPAAAGGRLDPTARPDVVLLTGGTDGGNAEVLLGAAEALVADGWRGPVVVAGNVEAREEVSAVLGGVLHVLAGNVVPRIGVLEPASARAAVREVFVSHVIGGKHLSASDAFTAMVRGATPDVVLRGVEHLAHLVGDVVVVDVGGATTDVHSVVALDPEDAGLARDVVAPSPTTRTVEGDLGMRWSAVTTVEAALRDASFLGSSGTGARDLVEAARVRAERPSYLPEGDADRDDDEAIARLAVGTALRRHAGRSRVVLGAGGRVVERTGVDLREVRLVVASGGVFRHGAPGAAERVLAGAVGTHGGGWQLPERPRVVVDHDGVLAAVGLLAETRPDLAGTLVRGWLDRPPGSVAWAGAGAAGRPEA